jgi:AcrR family transcriptional regulator
MSILERKEREKEQRKQVILSAAEKIFYEKGFETATMQDIADYCELSKGTLYLYFKTKNELCIAIYSKSLEKFREELIERINQTNDSIQKIKNITFCFIDFIDKHPAYYQAILNYRQHRSLCSEDSEFIKKSSIQHLEIANLIRKIIDEGIIKKDISSGIDPKQIANLIWNEKTGILSCTTLSNKDGLDYEACKSVNYFIEIIIKAIKE